MADSDEELTELIKECLPDISIDVMMLQNPTMEFVFKYYLLFLEKIQDLLYQDNDSVRQNIRTISEQFHIMEDTTLLKLFQYMKFYFKEMDFGMAFYYSDIVLPTARRTQVILKCIGNFLLLLQDKSKSLSVIVNDEVFKMHSKYQSLLNEVDECKSQVYAIVSIPIIILK